MTQLNNTPVMNVSTESKMSKAGRPFMIHSCTVADSNNNPITFKTGFKQPYKVGDLVTGTLVMNKFNEWELMGASGAPQQATLQSAPTARPSGGGYSGASPFPVPADHPENRIMRQNALAHATCIVTKQVELGHIPNDRMLITAAVIEYAASFVRWSTGRYELEAFMNLENLTATPNAKLTKKAS